MQPQNRDDHETLHRSILSFRRWVQSLVVLVVLFYFYWFAFHHSEPLSRDPSAWGQFGDFIGGILNPLLAYSAFHWVTRSVLIQGIELSETRAALREAANAQAAQATHAQSSIRISALKSLIDGSTSNIEWATKEIEYVSAQYARQNGPANVYVAIDGTPVPWSDLRDYLARKRARLATWVSEREFLLNKLRTELDAQNGA